jgi:VWFA-related protein
MSRFALFRSSYAFLIAMLLLVCVRLGFAQDVQMVPDQTDRDAAEKAQVHKDDKNADEPVTTFKTRSDLVQLFFNVKDKKGGLIGDLPKDQFEIVENGKPQAIKFFTASSNLPLTLGMMIDSSGSQQNVLDMEKVIGGEFLERILTAKDQAFVLSFDVSVELLHDFTSNVHALKTALNQAKINTGGADCGGIPGMGGGPVPCIGKQKGTLLYDAVSLASHDEMGQQVDRKAMILLTDGQDYGSQYTIKDAIEAAQKADTILYVLLVADRNAYGLGEYGGDSAMKKMTAETGGRVIDVGSKPEKLKAAFDQIAKELRSQYNIGYVPINTAKDGSFRKVEIRCKQEGTKVQARSGYYAVPE